MRCNNQHFHNIGSYVYKKMQGSVVVLLDLIGRWQSIHWEWYSDIVISQDLVVYLVLDKNLEEVQYILGFRVLQDCKNKKIVVCLPQ